MNRPSVLFLVAVPALVLSAAASSQPAEPNHATLGAGPLQQGVQPPFGLGQLDIEPAPWWSISPEPAIHYYSDRDTLYAVIQCPYLRPYDLIVYDDPLEGFDLGGITYQASGLASAPGGGEADAWMAAPTHVPVTTPDGTTGDEPPDLDDDPLPPV